MADTETDLTTLTVQLLSAYVSNNSVPSSELAALIDTTRTALAPRPPEPKALVPEQAAHVPAVSIRKSLGSREHILSMIDGKPYKSLKRHLSRHGLTPADYRARYELPKDYPMVAPGYSEARREVARRLGLGRNPAASQTSIAAVPEHEAEAAAATNASAEPNGADDAIPNAPEAEPVSVAKRAPRKATTTADLKDAPVPKRARKPKSGDASY